MTRVVLFESEPFFEKFVSETLRAEGFEVFTLDNPLDADFMINDIAADLVLYSYDSFASQWKEFNSKYPNKSLIVISTTQIPGDHVLIKPISKACLLKKVYGMIEK